MDKADLILVESEPRLGRVLLLLPEQGKEQKVNALPAFPVPLERCVFSSSARDRLKPYPCSQSCLKLRGTQWQEEIVPGSEWC